MPLKYAIGINADNFADITINATDKKMKINGRNSNKKDMDFISGCIKNISQSITEAANRSYPHDSDLSNQVSDKLLGLYLARTAFINSGPTQECWVHMSLNDKFSGAIKVFPDTMEYHEKPGPLKDFKEDFINFNLEIISLASKFSKGLPVGQHLEILSHLVNKSRIYLE